MDRKRKKKTSNEEWVNPHDPEAEVTKMKDGRTHLAYKAEQAVDLDTGVIVAITTHGGATGDSESVQETLPAAGFAVAEQIDTPTAQGAYQVHEQGLSQRRGFGGDERECSDLHFGSPTTTAQLGRQSGAKSGGLRQPAARGRRAGQELIAAAR